MAVDLKNNTMFGRISLVLLDDCLVKLDHGWSQDRVRRYMFDAIEGVIIWRRVPLLHLLVCTFVLLLPGIAILFIGNQTSTVLGIFDAGAGAVAILWYLNVKKATIRIVRAAKTDDIVGLFTSRRLRKFEQKLIAGIQQRQQASLTQLAGQGAAVMPAPVVPVESADASAAEPAPLE